MTRVKNCSQGHTDGNYLTGGVTVELISIKLAGQAKSSFARGTVCRDSDPGSQQVRSHRHRPRLSRVDGKGNK